MTNGVPPHSNCLLSQEPFGEFYEKDAHGESDTDPFNCICKSRVSRVRLTRSSTVPVL